MKVSKLALDIANEAVIDETAVGPWWCEGVRQSVEILRNAAETLPLWKWWLKPGLKLGAYVLELLADAKCMDQ